MIGTMFIIILSFIVIVYGVYTIEESENETGFSKIFEMSFGIFVIILASMLIFLYFQANYDFKNKENESESNNRNITCYQEFQSDTKVKFVCEVKK
jgi:uncharacterized membrane protein YhaH (DUF805 family)